MELVTYYVMFLNNYHISMTVLCNGLSTVYAYITSLRSAFDKTYKGLKIPRYAFDDYDYRVVHAKRRCQDDWHLNAA